jgi:hypothetical protein
VAAVVVVVVRDAYRATRRLAHSPGFLAPQATPSKGTPTSKETGASAHRLPSG